MNRKAAARAYTETRREMGIYCVRNLVTCETLLGRSVDVRAVLNREQTSLRFGGHANARLQHDWTALGSAAFTFEVLDTLPWPDDTATFDPTADLKVLEAMWRDRLQQDGSCDYAAPRAAPTPR
jgi:hypothetical protein